jgi:hypothetical protein
MGGTRKRDFDAVIGVGGIGREAQANRIDGKVNWLGIGPHKVKVAGKRGPEVTFDHYLDYGTRGPEFRKLAPLLAERMYAINVRILMQGLTPGEHAEAIAILNAAVDAPPSPGRDVAAGRKPGGRQGGAKCRSRRYC